MAENKKSKDILEALEEAEKVSAELNARKLRTQERIKKHIKPEMEVNRFEVNLELSKIEKESNAHQAKTTMVFFYILNLLGIAGLYYYKVGIHTEKVFLYIALACSLIFYAYYRSTK